MANVRSLDACRFRMRPFYRTRQADSAKSGIFAPAMEKGKIRILFICLGNICRSPAAQAVMQAKVDRAGLTARFEIDSAGIGAWHVGQLPDRRMRRAGKARGYDIGHRARQFSAADDFKRFDGIYVMDAGNFNDVARMAASRSDRQKIRLLADYMTRHTQQSGIPDPYYGDEAGFGRTIELIEDACDGLLRALTEHLPR
jgi:protein-tyrosine phosphatase